MNIDIQAYSISIRTIGEDLDINMHRIDQVGSSFHNRETDLWATLNIHTESGKAGLFFDSKAQVTRMREELEQIEAKFDEEGV